MKKLQVFSGRSRGSDPAHAGACVKREVGPGWLGLPSPETQRKGLPRRRDRCPATPRHLGPRPSRARRVQAASPVPSPPSLASSDPPRDSSSAYPEVEGAPPQSEGSARRGPGPHPGRRSHVRRGGGEASPGLHVRGLPGLPGRAGQGSGPPAGPELGAGAAGGSTQGGTQGPRAVGLRAGFEL